MLGGPRWKLVTQNTRELLQYSSNIRRKLLNLRQEGVCGGRTRQGADELPRVGPRHPPPGSIHDQTVSSQKVQTQDRSVHTSKQELPGEGGTTKLEGNKAGPPRRNDPPTSSSEARTRRRSRRDVWQHRPARAGVHQESPSRQRVMKVEKGGGGGERI